MFSVPFTSCRGGLPSTPSASQGVLFGYPFAPISGRTLRWSQERFFHRGGSRPWEGFPPRTTALSTKSSKIFANTAACDLKGSSSRTGRHEVEPSAVPQQCPCDAKDGERRQCSGAAAKATIYWSGTLRNPCTANPIPLPTLCLSSPARFGDGSSRHSLYVGSALLTK